jgi:CelD/BcsL family acetyltransferase involved in cellulose biosynthesis
MTLRVDEYNRIEQLAEIRSDWSRLLAITERATFFQSLEWLQVYWQHCAADQRLRTLLVSDKERPVGIVPLVVRREMTRVGWLRFLTYPLDYWGSYYGPIGCQPEPVLLAALKHLRNTKRDWDALELRWAGATDELRRSTPAAMRAAGLSAVCSQLDQTALVDLRGSWQEYLAARRSKWRNNLRRWQRKLEDCGRVDYQRFRPAGSTAGDDEPRWDLYDACLQVAAASWQGSSTTGTTLTHDAVRAFLRDVHAAAVRAGSVDVNLISVNHRPVAFAYNYVYRGYVFGLRVGFDPEWSHTGVGNVLYVSALEDSFARGDHTYDLGPGSLECKRPLQTSLRPIYRFSHFPWFPVRAQLLRIKRQWDERRSAQPAEDTSA